MWLAMASERYAKDFSCWDQYLAMAFAQLTYRESLRDIEACLKAVGGKLYHMGFRGGVARSTPPLGRDLSAGPPRWPTQMKHGTGASMPTLR